MSTRAEFLKKMAVGMVAGPAVVEALAAPVVTVPPVAVRTYVRIAIDNQVAARVAYPAGAFADLQNRIFDELWDAWAKMEIRHSAP